MSDGITARERVLMLTSTLPRWAGDSTQRFVLDLAAHLSTPEREIHVLAPGHPGAAAFEQMEGVNIHRFAYMTPPELQTLCYGGGIMPTLKANPLKWMLVPPFIGAAARATRRLMRRIRPDIVHAHWILPMGMVGAWTVPRSMPFLVTVHGSDALSLRSSLPSRIKRRVLERADVVTCNGSVTEAALKGSLPTGKPLLRVPMGASATRGHVEHGEALEAERFSILFAGRLFRGKGLDDVFVALAGFPPHERPFLLIAGRGPEETRFRNVAAELGIEADVRFLGGLEQQRLLSLMRDVSAVVVPTRNNEWVEAQGLVLAEAMLAGTPVIATTGGGAEDHVRHQVTGLLVPPATPVAIIAALRFLISNAEQAKEMSRAAEAYARANLTWEATAQKFAAAYERMIEAAGRAST